MKQILFSILFLFALTCSGQETYLKVYNPSELVFCGMSDAILDVDTKNRKVTLTTKYGNLNLKVLKQNAGRYKSYKCEDQSGNKYLVTPIENDTGGSGLIFEPETDYMYTFEIANQPLCDESER